MASKDTRATEQGPMSIADAARQFRLTRLDRVHKAPTGPSCPSRANVAAYGFSERREGAVMGVTRGLLVGVGLAAVVLGAGAANAKIICRGAFQIVDGQPIATPYCEDANVAAVAREYGIRVSAREVRTNPGVKARVCRTIGYDNRVQSACTGYREPFPRWRF